MEAVAATKPAAVIGTVSAMPVAAVAAVKAVAVAAVTVSATVITTAAIISVPVVAVAVITVPVVATSIVASSVVAAVVPGTGSDEDTAYEVIRAVVAVRGAGVGIVAVIPIRAADRRATDVAV
jgi:hypothetical protein